MKQAILVVSFGTTYPDTRRKTIEACEAAIQARFPDFKVCRAFTSGVVMRRIKQNEGLTIPTVAEALEELKAAGFNKVYIQPLHIILGGEYEKILAQVATFQAEFELLKVGKPLLYHQKDYEQIKAILLEIYGQLAPEEATVLMGHGSQHYAFTAYAALDHMLTGTGVHLACVESYPEIDLIEAKLKALNIRRVHLAPFMLVAGDHALNDLLSDDEESWHSYFKAKGYQVVCHAKGLGEYPAIQALYLEHLEDLMD